MNKAPGKKSSKEAEKQMNKENIPTNSAAKIVLSTEAFFFILLASKTEDDIWELLLQAWSLMRGNENPHWKRAKTNEFCIYTSFNCWLGYYDFSPYAPDSEYDNFPREKYS